MALIKTTWMPSDEISMAFGCVRLKWQVPPVLIQNAGLPNSTKCKYQLSMHPINLIKFVQQHHSQFRVCEDYLSRNGECSAERPTFSIRLMLVAAADAMELLRRGTPIFSNRLHPVGAIL